MNVKVAVTLLCAIQLASGLSFNVSSITSIFDEVAEKVHDYAVQAEEKFETAINDLVAQATDKVEEIKDELQAELDEIASKSQAAYECVQAQKDNVTKLVDLAKSAVTSYGIKEGLKVLPLVGKINSTYNKAKDASAALVQQAKSCGFLSLSCYSGVVQSAVSQAKAIGSEASDEFLQVVAAIQTAEDDLETSFDSLYAQEKTEVQAILDETNACVEGSQAATSE
ncbi:hypothetical protein C0J52_16296 [Blattella germanica]|nr:hypothetical protein C0J52_16296 [Blattella germanica]